MNPFRKKPEFLQEQNSFRHKQNLYRKAEFLTESLLEETRIPSGIPSGRNQNS
jgi:hypothetical protein